MLWNRCYVSCLPDETMYPWTLRFSNTDFLFLQPYKTAKSYKSLQNSLKLQVYWCRYLCQDVGVSLVPKSTDFVFFASCMLNIHLILFLFWKMLSKLSTCYIPFSPLNFFMTLFSMMFRFGFWSTHWQIQTNLDRNGRKIENLKWEHFIKLA